MLKRLFVLGFLTIHLLSCKNWNDKKPSSADAAIAERLQAKADLYLKLAKVDENGWITDTKCDGLLFNSLYGVAGGRPDILLAMGDSGVWYRHWRHDCYPDGSASTISRDMFAGLFIWIFKHKKIDLIDQIIAYGESHVSDFQTWIMGEGDPFRTRLRLDGMGAAYEIRYKLGGADHNLRHLPIPRFDIDGYEEHLQVLNILLWGLLRGEKINDGDLKSLKRSVEKSPENALFQAVYHRYLDGDQSAAIAILLDEKLFPSDRLPSTLDHNGFYLWEREKEAREWQAPPMSEPIKEHSGVDFLFVKAIVLGEL